MRERYLCRVVGIGDGPGAAIEERDDVDVGGVVELAAAMFAEGEDGKAGIGGGRGRNEVALFDGLADENGKPRGKRGVGKVGKGGAGLGGRPAAGAFGGGGQAARPCSWLRGGAAPSAVSSGMSSPAAASSARIVTKAASGPDQAPRRANRRGRRGVPADRARRRAGCRGKRPSRWHSRQGAGGQAIGRRLARARMKICPLAFFLRRAMFPPTFSRAHSMRMKLASAAARRACHVNPAGAGRGWPVRHGGQPFRQLLQVRQQAEHQ